MNFTNQAMATTQNTRSQQDEERFEAIKDLLVGSNFERINSKFKSLNQRVESGNNHLSKLVKELSLDFNQLKSDLSKQLNEEKKIRFADAESLRDDVKAIELNLEQAQKDTKASKSLESLEEKYLSLESQLDEALKGVGQSFEGKVGELAQSVKAQNEVQHELKQEIGSFKENVNSQFEKQKTQHVALKNDLGQLKQTVTKEITNRTEEQNAFSQKLENLQNTVKKELEQKVNPENFVKKESHTETLQHLKQDLQEEIRSTEQKIGGRLPQLAESFTQAFEALDKKVSHNLTDLQEKHQQLEKNFAKLKADGSQSVKQEVEQSLRALEDELTGALENMSGTIFKRFTQQDDQLKKQTQDFSKLTEELQTVKKQQAIAFNEVNPKVAENSEAIGEMRELLQTDVFNYFKKVKEEREEMQNKLAHLESQMDQKMDTALLKMDAKMEAYLSLTQKQIKEDKTQQEKKKALKATLQQLTDLLNE